MPTPLCESNCESEAVTFHGFKGPTLRHVRPNSSEHATFAKIPKVDCLLIGSPHLEDRIRIAHQVGKAFQEVGFLYAINHSIPNVLEAKTYRSIREFFDLPLEEKMKVHNSASSVRRGYQYLLEGRGDDEIRHGEPALTAAKYLLARQTKYDLKDLREAFKMCPDPRDEQSGISAAAYSSGSGNLWPRAPEDFQQTLYEYWAAVHRFAIDFIRIVALSLGAEEHYFDDKITPFSGLSPLYYPPNANDRNSMGRSIHTDYSWITFINQLSPVSGLEVLDNNGCFVGVPPVPNSLVVNVGDFLERASNDVFKSTIHRVVNNKDEKRYSLAYFFDANPEATIVVIESCIKEGRPKKYEAIKAETWQKEFAALPKKVGVTKS